MRRALPIALLVLAVASAIIVANGFAVRESFGCGACHRDYHLANDDSAHAGLGCAECHASPGLTGIVADGVRSVRWTVVMPFRDARRTFAPEHACRECHSETLIGVAEASVRVRHADFAGERCARCHAGIGHRLEERWYTAPLMEDCTGCHRVSISNIRSCDLCHATAAEGRTRPEGESFFRASHGTGWERSHGMGDLGNCSTCHAPGVCARCHGVPLPHQQGWQRVHGKGLPLEIRMRCETCHSVEWCTECHGVEMPHPVGFAPQHGELAEADAQRCFKCHSQGVCAGCHERARHTQAEGADYHSDLSGP